MVSQAHGFQRIGKRFFDGGSDFLQVWPYVPGCELMAAMPALDER